MSESDESIFGSVFLVILICLALYTLSGAVIEHFNILWIHETGIGILLGALIGFLMY